MTTPAYDRLNSGYYNSNQMTTANPGGLAGAGAVRKNFFLGLIADLMSVISDVLSQLGSAVGAANAVGTSASNITVPTTGQTRSLIMANPGAKTFSPGMNLMVARSSAALVTWFTATATAYNSATGQLDLTCIDCAPGAGGTGNFNDWSVSLTGGTNTTTSTFNVTKDLKLTGVISPAALAADQNDWAPANLSTASTIKASGTAARTITGLTGGAEGRVILLENIGTFDLILAANNAGSVAANRFDLSTAFALRPRQAVLLTYDATAVRWRLAGDGPAQAADIRTGTDLTVGITPGDYYAAVNEVALTDAPTVAVDMSTFLDASLSIAASAARTLGNPTNVKPGQKGRIRVIHGGGDSLAMGSAWKRQGGAATFSSGAGKIDFIDYDAVSSSYIRYNINFDPS